MHGPLVSHQFPISHAFLAGSLRHECHQEDLLALETALEQPHALADGHRLVAQGEALGTAHLLTEGFMFSVIERAGRRFIVGVHVPGDFVDLHGFALKRLDHDLVAAGSIRVAAVSHRRLQDATEARPGLMRALWSATLLEAAIHRQWIRNLEGLDAPQRIAHLFAELQLRLAMTGHAVGRTLRTPFTQTDLADMCGVSAIHANRAVARLRDLGLGEIRRGALYTDKWDQLRAYAEFDPGYLYAAPPLSR